MTSNPSASNRVQFQISFLKLLGAESISISGDLFVDVRLWWSETGCHRSGRGAAVLLIHTSTPLLQSRSVWAPAMEQEVRDAEQPTSYRAREGNTLVHRFLIHPPLHINTLFHLQWPFALWQFFGTNVYSSPPTVSSVPNSVTTAPGFPSTKHEPRCSYSSGSGNAHVLEYPQSNS